MGGTPDKRGQCLTRASAPPPCDGSEPAAAPATWVLWAACGPGPSDGRQPVLPSPLRRQDDAYGGRRACFPGRERPASPSTQRCDQTGVGLNRELEATHATIGFMSAVRDARRPKSAPGSSAFATGGSCAASEQRPSWTGPGACKAEEASG